MADTLGVYFKTGGAETGGTNALTGLDSGATRLSVADAETSPLTIASLDTAYTLYYKAEDDATFLDTGNDTNASFTVTVPTDFLTSVDASTNWSGSCSVPPARGCFRPVYVKQTARVTSADQDVEMGTGGVTFSAGVRVAQVGTVTASAGDGAVTLSWTDLDMSANGRYEIHRSTASGFDANLVILTTTLADGSASYVNNSANGNAPVNDTLYYYRVRAVDARGVGAWSAAVSATPVATAALYAGTSTIDTAAGITYGVQAVKLGRSSTGVLWTAYLKTNTVSNVYVAYSLTGGLTWSSAEAVDPDTTNAQIAPAVTVDNDGVVHVIYSERGTTYDFIKHAYGSSGSWTVETVVAEGAKGMDYNHLLVDDSDNLHVAYRYDSAGVADVYYVKGTADGDGTWTWSSPEIVLGDGSSDDFIYVDIALDDGGYPYIVGGETTGDDVWFSHKRGASWTAPAEVNASGYNNAPCSIYVTGSGTSAVVLIAFTDSSQDLTVLKSTDGGANFTSTAQAQTSMTGTNIVVTGSDTAYVVFNHDGTGTREVYAYPYTISTGAFGSIVTVSASSAASAAMGQLLGQRLPSASSRYQEASAGLAMTYVIASATPVLKFFGSSGVTA